MRTLHSFLFFVFIAPFPNTVKANEQTLTIAEALAESKSGSLQVQRQESVVVESTWKKYESYSGLLPTVTLGASYLFDKKYGEVDTAVGGNNVTIAQIVPTTQYSLKVNLPLFDGFANSLKKESSESFESAATKELEWTQFAVERQTIMLFYKSLAAQMLTEVTEQNLKTLNDYLSY